MIKIMLIGKSGCGKTSFIQAIHNQQLQYKKTQAIEVVDNCIDTPGEFLELRSLYRALVVTSCECDLIILCQDCSDERNFFPPSFSSMFAKPIIGMVLKTDIGTAEEIEKAKDCLAHAGAKEVFEVSNVSRTGIDNVIEHLKGVETCMLKKIN